MIELPYPARCLWPNGRSHWATKAREFKKHKEWAAYAVQDLNSRRGLGREVKLEGRVDWRVTVHPKTRHPVDDDNARASLKAYQDGFALAFGIDDNLFNAPMLVFGEPIKGGLVQVEFL